MLIECPECKSQVSDKAPACPRCGHPMSSPVARVETAPAVAPHQVASVSPSVQIVYQPILPPREVRQFGVLISFVSAGLGLYLLLSWIPDHTLSIGSLVQGRAILDPEMETWAKVLAWAFVVAGAINLLIGGTKRDAKLAFCTTCKMQVVARKRGRHHQCERCDATL